MKTEKLQLNKKFLVIESPIPFEIYCPEQNDGVKRRQGSWQMTIHDLLTKSHYPLNPIYNLELIYDETLLNENETVSWYTTDLNLGEALRGIDGQLVTLGDSVIDSRIVNFPEEFNINKLYNFNNMKKEKKYFSTFTNVSNLRIIDCDFCFKNGNVFTSIRSGKIYIKAGSTVVEKDIIGLTIYGSSLVYFTTDSDSVVSIPLSNLTFIQGYFSGVNL